MSGSWQQWSHDKPTSETSPQGHDGCDVLLKTCFLDPWLSSMKHVCNGRDHLLQQQDAEENGCVQST